MPRDKKILYALAVVATAGLIPTVLLGGRYCLAIAAAWLTLSMLAVLQLIRKRRAPSVNRRTVLLLMAVFAVVYFILFYLSGLRLGFVRVTVPLTAKTLLNRLLPIALAIVASEIVRRVLLCTEDRIAAALSFLIGLLSEVAIVGGFDGVDYFNALMDMAGLTILPAVSSGALYHFVSARHGALPCIAYRLLFTLVPYLVPVTPNVPDALIAFIGLALPLLLLLFLRTLFEKRVKRATAKPHRKWIGLASALLAFLLAAGMIALVSGQFRYAAIVIATGSMTGELNVGDTVIYEQYKEQDIREGDIVVFERDRALVVHRVVEITHINGVTRYYTKGDANETRDAGFITASDVVGILDFKISYIGYPTLWMHRIFGS